MPPYFILLFYFIMETINYRGHTIEIDLDEYPEDPREWYNLGTMICNHWGYNLWDEKIECHWESILDDLHKHLDVTPSELERDYIVLPLYLYDHSWITMNTTWFSCRWDSWQVGRIYVSKTDARKHYNTKRLNRDTVIKDLIEEVDTYDHYLTWEIYMWNIWEWWNGTYYSEEDAIAEAKHEIDHTIKYLIKQHISYIKWCIKSWVNILYRKQFKI